MVEDNGVKFTYSLAGVLKDAVSPGSVGGAETKTDEVPTHSRAWRCCVTLAECFVCVFFSTMWAACVHASLCAGTRRVPQAKRRGVAHVEGGEGCSHCILALFQCDASR